MKPKQKEGHQGLFRRIGLIVVALLAMTQTVLLLRPGPSSHGDFRVVAIVPEPDAGRPIPAEAGAFRDLRAGLLNVGEAAASPHVVVLTRAYRSGRRAYDGAPPFIPHPLEPEVERTQDCTPCHAFGGYNPPLRTYTPRSPHPEMEGCLQCHLVQVTTGVFVASDWVTPEAPPYGFGGAVLGAPPAMPHPIQMREHCVSCHGGASAAPDIRTDHPERFNCRQCHVATEATNGFSRPLDSGAGR